MQSESYKHSCPVQLYPCIARSDTQIRFAKKKTEIISIPIAHGGTKRDTALAVIQAILCSCTGW